MELDEINEGLSRQEIISRLKALGKNYNFDILTKDTFTNCLSFFENFYKERNDYVL